MRNKKILLILLSTGVFLHSCVRDSNRMLIRQLSRSGYSFVIDGQGDFQVKVVHEGNSRDLWIYGFTYPSGSIQIREILAPVRIEDSAYNPLLYEQLLMDHYKSEDWGAWSLAEEEGQKLLIYRIQIPEDHLILLLDPALKNAARVTEEMESHFIQDMDSF